MKFVWREGGLLVCIANILRTYLYERTIMYMHRWYAFFFFFFFFLLRVYLILELNCPVYLHVCAISQNSVRVFEV